MLKVIGARPPYVLAGHSYGGIITREFAALYPGQVAGIVLLDAHARTPADSLALPVTTSAPGKA